MEVQVLNIFFWKEYSFREHYCSCPLGCLDLPRISGGIVLFNTLIHFYWNSAWVNLLSESELWGNAVACIGETTALAAKRSGLRNVYYPTNPGLEG